MGNTPSYLQFNKRQHLSRIVVGRRLTCCMREAMSIDRLRRLAESAPGWGPDGEWLAEAFQQYLDHAHNGATLDQALGVAVSRGQRPWWIREKRQRALEALATLNAHVATESYRSRADEIVAMLRRYQSARWKHDRNATPAPSTDPVRAAMHAVLAGNGGEIPSRQLIDSALETVVKKSAI